MSMQRFCCKYQLLWKLKDNVSTDTIYQTKLRSYNNTKTGWFVRFCVCIFKLLFCAARGGRAVVYLNNEETEGGKTRAYNFSHNTNKDNWERKPKNVQ